MRRHALYMILLAVAPVLAAAILYGPEVIAAQNAAERASQNLASLEAEWAALTAAAAAETDPVARLEYQRFEGPLLSDVSRAADIWQYHDMRFRDASSMFWRIPLAFFALALAAWGCLTWFERHLGPQWRSEVVEVAKQELAQLGPDADTGPPYNRLLSGR